jgi:hypothetical protein
MTNNAAPKGLPHFVLAAARDSSTMRLKTVKTYTGFSIKLAIFEWMNNKHSEMIGK